MSRDYDPSARAELVAVAGQIVAASLTTAEGLGSFGEDELATMADQVARIAVVFARALIRKVDGGP